jgi:hypothetical protein
MKSLAPKDLLAGALALACAAAVVLATARDAVAVLGPAVAATPVVTVAPPAH